MVAKSSARRSQSVSQSVHQRASKSERGRRAIAQAISATPVAMESLERRQLLAVTFSYSINDPGKTYRDLYDRVRLAMNAAGNAWASHFEGDASIEVELQFRTKDEAGLALAAALPVAFQKTGVNSSGIDLVDPGPLYEIKTGTDPNGQEPDAIVIWTAEVVPTALFDDSPNREVGANQFDAITIATHELGHVLGFYAGNFGSPFFNPASGDIVQTNFGDKLVPFDDPDDRFGSTVIAFDGTAANSVFGGPVPIDFESAAHYGTPEEFRNEPVDKLRTYLMFPIANVGRVIEIGALDVAILADIGMPVVDDFPEPPTSGPVLQITGTSAVDTIEVIATGNQFIVKRNFVTQTETFSIDDFTSINIDALGGNDRIILSGELPAVSVNGGDGNDTIIGGAGDDTLTGAAGADRIYGNTGNDLINGGGGKDILYGGDGSDTVFGGRQNDYLDGGSGNELLDGGADDDNILGNGGEDNIFGSSGDDTLSGGSSRDTLNGGGGADVLNGGGGNDVVDYSDRTAPLFLSADTRNNDGEAGEGDNIDGGIEVFLGGSAGDKMLGSGLNNTLIGNEGDDTLVGGSGNDRLEGGSGSDALDGSSGDDSLVGGGGNDRMVGGTGGDRFFGMDGNDLFYSKDRFADSLEGGAGDDLFDGDDIDVLLEIEGAL